MPPEQISANSNYLLDYPKHIISALARQALRQNVPIYFAGGPVRDWLMGQKPTDLDITIPCNPFTFAHELANDIHGTIVPLSEAEGVVRIVKNDLWLDISSFREQSTNIEDDLQKRDFTINAMALVFNSETKRLGRSIIDPTSGVSDLRNGIIRITSKTSFTNDPLRMLRAFRFAACLDFEIAADTKVLIKQQASLLNKSAGERLTAELDKIMATRKTAVVIREMAETELLWHVFPDLYPGVGMAQPASHHLDVFDHNLEALTQMERIISNPDMFFSAYGEIIKNYLARKRKKIQLKLAALLHDLGKPSSFALRNGKRTFYNHDLAGAKMLCSVAKRLKWSVNDQKAIALLIKQHMRPFHLLNAKSKQGLSNKAYLKLIKAVGDELIGLFLLSMADSLAGCGPGKPLGMEDSLSALFGEIYHVNKKILQPVLSNPLLLNGRDLIRLGQNPGPDFSRFFRELEILQIDNPKMTKSEALQIAATFFKSVQ